jgi:hypothetical protein
MAKEIKTILKLQIPAGQANPASFRLLGTLKKPLGFLRRFAPIFLHGQTPVFPTPFPAGFAFNKSIYFN